MVYLITGKAKSGKSTYAFKLAQEYSARGYHTKIIDGDEYRKIKGNQDYTDEGRKRNLFGAAVEAAQYERNGFIVILAFIAPRKRWRNIMRKEWKESVLVYIPGGELWPGTSYETPKIKELRPRKKWRIL